MKRLNKFEINNIVNVIFITLTLSMVVTAIAYTIALMVTVGDTAETEGMMIVIIVTILTACFVVPLMTDEYKENTEAMNKAKAELQNCFDLCSNQVKAEDIFK